MTEEYFSNKVAAFEKAVAEEAALKTELSVSEESLSDDHLSNTCDQKANEATEAEGDVRNLHTSYQE